MIAWMIKFCFMIKNIFNSPQLYLAVFMIIISSPFTFSEENGGANSQSDSQIPVEVTASPEELMEVAGIIISQQSGMSRFDLKEGELAALIKGLKAGIRGQSPSPEQMKILPQLQTYFSKRIAEKQASDRVNDTEFLEKIALTEGIQKDPKGFFYKISNLGTGDFPKMDQSVTVHYEGSLSDGTVFDSSYQRGTPAKFPMSGVIKGFSGGLSKIKPGGKITIYIPSELGYGENPPGGVIKPGSVLIFECELISIGS